MKKRLYLACGKTFAKKEEAVAHIFKTYTTTLVRDGMGNVRDANWVSGLRRLEEGKYAPVPYSKNAPESFSLREAMPPVYDQASRGTCAANAGTALVEYYEGCKTRLSVQYLYERMKRAERDAYRIAAEELMSGGVVSNPDMAEEARAIAASLAARQSSGESVSCEDVAARLYNMRVEMDGGSSAKYLFSVLDNYGICSYEIWPYAREQLDSLDLVSDRNNCYMPPGADADAKRHRLNDEYYIFPSPNNVEEIKNYLSGSRRWKPMPVYLGVRLFADENGFLPLDGGVARMPKLTKITIQTAQFEVPGLMGAGIEKATIDPDTVEDVDTIEVLDMKGGGGHAMLLVGYEEDMSIPGGGAFIVRNSWGGDWGDGGYGRLPYAYVELFATSAATILVPKDVGEIVVHPDAEDCEGLAGYLQTATTDMKDSSGKWRIAKGAHVIVDDDGVAEPDTPSNRRRFVANGKTWSGAHVRCAARGDKTVVASASGRLFSCIESSFANLSRQPIEFPLLGGVSKGGIFCSRPKAEHFRRVADLTIQYGSPLAIYEASGGEFCFRIAVASVGSTSETAGRADALRQIVSDYAKSHRFELAQYTVCVLELPVGAEADIAPYVGENEALILLDGYTPDVGWHVCAASCGNDGAWFEWLRRLGPNSPAQWELRVGRAFDEVASGGGHVTLEKLATKLSVGPNEVASLVTAFLPGAKIAGGKVTKA